MTLCPYVTEENSKINFVIYIHAASYMLRGEDEVFYSGIKP